MPTIPHRLAGWRMDPPVSVPRETGASHAATAAADPPDDPPGIRSRSHGLRVVKYALFSVDEPMANSSMFVLPIRTASAALSRSTTWASYGGTNPLSILLLHVVGTPLVHRTSLTATGTPARAPSFSPFL